MRRRGFGFILIRISNYSGKMPCDCCPLFVQALAERRPIGKTKHKGDACLTEGIGRQHLRLTVVHGLQGVLGIAQKTISCRKLIYCRRR